MPNAPKWIFDVAERLLPKLSLMEVVNIETLTPTIKIIRFKGNLEKIIFQIGSYIDFRVSDTEVRRYTVGLVDSIQEHIEFIVYLNRKGTGCGFMNGLKIGDKINLNPPSARKYYDKYAEKFVIFGNETSLGLALTFLPVLKENKKQFQFYFKLDEENINVPKILGIENFRAFVKDSSFRNEEWVSNLPVMNSIEWQNANFVLTGNVKSAQTFWKVIKNKTNRKVHLHGYWLEGKKGL